MKTDIIINKKSFNLARKTKKSNKLARYKLIKKLLK